ncbi:hypothetical protein [Nitrosopumilus adriaticus]|uniref:hypothetical protein n=1 Tax=Nitrosopumilus adriaticus TaxID=1580092 RepID=UPI00352CD3EC
MKKIILAVVIAFLVTSSMFFLTYKKFPTENIEINDHDFFDQEFNNNEKIFLLGSSHTGQINSTLIQEKMEEIDPKVSIYNLAYNGDNPKKRMGHVDKIIGLEPSFVFYGISYRDFENVKDEIDSPFHIGNIISNYLDENGVNDINPKLITLEVIRDFLTDKKVILEDNKIRLFNEPFFSFHRSQTIILDDTELKKQIQHIRIPNINDRESNENVKYLKEFIKKMNDNDIEIIIFATPVHKYYFENLPELDKKEFGLILKEIENEFNLKVYDYTHKYAELPIWYELTHVSYNKKSMIYSVDISEMIIHELIN